MSYTREEEEEEEEGWGYRCKQSATEQTDLVIRLIPPSTRWLFATTTASFFLFHLRSIPRIIARNTNIQRIDRGNNCAR